MRYFIPTILLATLLVTSCQSGNIYVPVSSAGEMRRSGIRLYVVRPGDTLYSIAFRFGMDYKELASLNNIHQPYTIYVDQRIKLSKRASAKKPVPTTIAKPTTAKPTTLVTPRILTPKVKDSNINWRWPYDGKVVNNFNGKINKGIDIKGKLGGPVKSTADGVVVYAGGGLRGYGKLVIVKHNDRFLSAYGHNEAILVKEGQRVKAGQVVARLGGTNSDKELLHFEIRRNGKPQDPLQYLPRRSGGS